MPPRVLVLLLLSVFGITPCGGWRVGGIVECICEWVVSVYVCAGVFVCVRACVC